MVIVKRTQISKNKVRELIDVIHVVSQYCLEQNDSNGTIDMNEIYRLVDELDYNVEETLLMNTLRVMLIEGGFEKLFGEKV